LAIWLLLKSQWRSALSIMAASILPYLCWSMILWLWSGVLPFSSPLAKPLLIPFIGAFNMEGIESAIIVCLWSVLPALIGGLVGLVHLLRNRSASESPEGMLTLANAVFIAVLPLPTWMDPLAVLRLGAGLMFALLLWLARARPAWLLFMAGLWGPSLMLLFMIPGFL
jgi:hypothetical protein